MKFGLFIVFFSFVVFSSPLQSDSTPRPATVPDTAIFRENTWITDTPSELRIWNLAGKLVYRCGKKGELLHGSCEMWDHDGRKVMDAEYLDGKQVWIKNVKILNNAQRPQNVPKTATWNKNTLEWRWKDEKRNIVYLWYINGEKKFIGQYDEKGDLHGILKTMHPNGNLQVQANFIHGKHEGLSYAYYPDKKLKKMTFYRADIPIWIAEYDRKAPNAIPENAVWEPISKKWLIAKKNIFEFYSESGSLFKTIQRDGNDFHGKVIIYYPPTASTQSGDSLPIFIEGQYDKSQKSGVWIRYNRKGEIEKKIEAKDVDEQLFDY